MKLTIIKSCLARFSGIFAAGTPSNIHGTAISYRCAKFGAFVNSVTILTLRDLTIRSSLLQAVLDWRNPLHGDDKNQMILALFRPWSSKSSKSSTELGLIVHSFQGACLNVGYTTAKKQNKHSQRTFPWSSVRCLCPIASCSVSVG